jgi:hypothetical protein
MQQRIRIRGLAIVVARACLWEGVAAEKRIGNWISRDKKLALSGVISRPTEKWRESG